MEIAFHGAAGTVTGSKFLVSHSGGGRVLVDCGLFQGVKKLRQRNWSPLEFDPSAIDSVILTHAHIDHTGFLPVLVRQGYAGPVHCTAATADLASILLPDSGRIHEEDARHANREGYSRHRPAEPLYTEADALRALESLHPVELGAPLETAGFTAVLQGAGHILGAAGVTLRRDGEAIHFSGDLGRPEDLLLHPPEPPPAADWIVMESTYGDRNHKDRDPLEAMRPIVERTLERRGVLLIPSFAVGRAQTMLYCLWRLFREHGVPEVPVFLDSPMATSATELYRRHHRLHRLSADEANEALGLPTFTRSPAESKKVSASKGPMIVISASGMATAGRVLHHLKAFAPHPENTILIPGFQAPGTRGAAIAGGAEAVKIHGRYVPIRAEVAQVDIFSAHADQGDLLAWLGARSIDPKQVFLVHGEPAPADVLRRRIAEVAGLAVHVPDQGETVSL